MFIKKNTLINYIESAYIILFKYLHILYILFLDHDSKASVISLKTTCNFAHTIGSRTLTASKA